MLYDFLYEFSVVAREGNLSVAAQRLGLSRASLGRHMDALETQLGATLMRRGPEGVRLTPDGRYALATAVKVASLGEGARNRCRGNDAGCAEVGLTVAGLTDCATPVGLLARSCAQASDARRRFLCETLAPQEPEAAVRLLAEGRADVALLFCAPGLRWGGFASTPLCTVAAAVALDPSHADGVPGDLATEDLARCRFARRAAIGTPDDGSWEEFARAAGARGVALRQGPRGIGLASHGTGWEDGAIACAAEGRSADILRASGLRVARVRDLDLEVVALYRADDPVATDLVTRAAAAFASGERASAASRESIYASLPKDGARPEAGLAADSMDQGRVFSKVLHETPVTEDLVLPDGRVVDRAYVALRNRLNRIADGLSGDPVPTSYDAIMHLWSVDEARAMLEMPMFGLFSAYDWAASSGRDEGECAALLENLAGRGLIYRVRRGGVPSYSLLPWAYGIWEFRIGKNDTEFLNLDIYGSEQGTGSKYPIMHVCPVGPEAVEGGRIAPYRDWQAHVRRQERICVVPCQCHTAEKALDPRRADDGRPEEVCFTFGEMADYWLENGQGSPVTRDECLGRVQEAIERYDLVPQLYYDKNPEVLCLCRPGCCLVLSAVKATDGHAASMPLSSIYTLRYDRNLCVGCGSCAERCPMEAVQMDETGGCRTGDTCVACGQCVAACPVRARILVVKDTAGNAAELPADMLEGYRWRSEDRMAKGYISDFAGSRLEVRYGA